MLIDNLKPNTPSPVMEADLEKDLQFGRDLVRLLSTHADKLSPIFEGLFPEVRSLMHILTQARDFKFGHGQERQKFALRQLMFRCQTHLKHLKRTIHESVEHGCWPGYCDFVSKIDESFLAQYNLAINFTALELQIASDVLSLRAMLANLLLSRLDPQINYSEPLQTDDALVEHTNRLILAHADLILTISSTLASKAHTEAKRTKMLTGLMQNIQNYNLALDGYRPADKSVSPGIPPQVALNEPVYLEDAAGYIAPFHLEFVPTFEALDDVLQRRFCDHPGEIKVDARQYAFWDCASGGMISKPGRSICSNGTVLEGVFSPGMRIIMSMEYLVLRTSKYARRCPVCSTTNLIEGTRVTGPEEVKCKGCNVSYRRMIRPSEPAPEVEATSRDLGQQEPPYDESDESDDDGEYIRRTDAWDNFDDIQAFRHNHIFVRNLGRPSDPSEFPSLTLERHAALARAGRLLEKQNIMVYGSKWPSALPMRPASGLSGVIRW